MPMKSLLAAAVLLLSSGSAFAAADLEFSQALSPAFHMAADGRYKLVEKKAGQTMDLLKALRNYSEELKDRAEKLRKEMLGNHYDDMVNNQLLPNLFEAKAAYEAIDKTCDLEKKNVGAGLKSAKGGDYSGIDAALARIAAFEKDNEARVKAIDSKVAAVSSAYERDFGAAKSALAQFSALPLIKELLASKPRLVRKIELQPASIRPLQWRVEFVKEHRDYNDPRFSQIPRSVVIADGTEYPVLIR